MSFRTLPDKALTTICFAHPAYRLGERFVLRDSGVHHIEVRSLQDLQERVHEADVLVVSGLWRNEMILLAPRLAFLQSISAGIDQYDKSALQRAGIRAASAQGANERAVAEHAIALILALVRKIPMARDNQLAGRWRGLISEIAQREDELGGKTLVIVGLGRIGSRLATLAKAFDMRVIGVKRNPGKGGGSADETVPQEQLHAVLRDADFVALTCPLTPETENLIDADALAAMKPSAYLVNVARGRVVEQAALVAALEQGRIAGAALDCVLEEPLPESAALWQVRNLLITPHSAGETQRYEDNVIDLLMENLDRQWRGDSTLRNGFV